MRNEVGFTLLEVIITLLLTMTILSISVPLISLFKTEDYYTETSARQLSAIIQEELNQSRSFMVRSEILSFIDQQQRHVVIDQYESVVRRRVDRKGHEVMIQGVRNIHFSRKESSIQMKVEMMNGAIYKYLIHLPK
ncbi:Putative Competence protein ComGF [Halobacillus dabanensis]|uniref:Putative Competence protein ComGF n=1 Tax=Halobacillus dabanensis TaxID=240302 RepID=A0A1I3PI46_HALDA|nr:competence type IV pilus minor pilin ComGF [Halobacillus dabanensis]SFJ21153.1 Putative Competence protein ComGF [Halobacillus dabanensis]